MGGNHKCSNIGQQDKLAVEEDHLGDDVLVYSPTEAIYCEVRFDDMQDIA